MTRRYHSSERGGGGGRERIEGEGGGEDTKPTKGEFLVSFLVDARGGAMTGSRSSQVRLVIPPRAAQQPIRVTCRQLRVEAVLHPPLLSDGEGLASRIIQLTPAAFLSPVLLEVHHATPVTKDREVVVYRCDSGRKWSQHINVQPDSCLNNFLSSSISNLTVCRTGGLVTIVTDSLPQYFALISRPRHQTIHIGVEGGLATSDLAPGLQCFFPPRALTKPVSIGLSVCRACPQPSGETSGVDKRHRPQLLADLMVQGGAVSPVITIIPRRRKFHKAVTMTLPVPQPNKEVSGGDNQSSKIEMSQMLLCSMSESGSRAVWEDVTSTTPLSFNQGVLQFTTVVSAAFWLVNIPTWMVADSIPMLDKLFRSMTRVPYLAELCVYWRQEDDLHWRQEDDVKDLHAQLRVLIYTQGERNSDDCLETREGFKPLAKSSEVVIWDKSEVEVAIKGNLGKVSESGRIIFNPFRENRLTLGVRRLQNNVPAAANLLVLAEEIELCSASILLNLQSRRRPP